jgi:hypothetical protein
MPPPELEFPPDPCSERTKAGSLLLAATFLTVGVRFTVGCLLAAGSSLVKSVLAPGSKMQLCRIAPEPTMNVEHNRTRMI